MAKGFTLSILPWVYMAQYEEIGTWKESFVCKPHREPAEEEKMGEKELDDLLLQRNSFPEIPLVNYTSQYGMGCFEGLKAFPQKDGTLKIFRPDRNAARMKRSMEGLKMPPFPVDNFVSSILEIVRRNRDLGFYPVYSTEWEKDGFSSGHSVYIRPFTFAESSIGLGLSRLPWMIIVTTPVGAYFKPGSTKAVTTKKVRAFPGGTGWIKCNANYVVPILAKKEAEAEGYMEAIFLDGCDRKYIEEGSSCNIFILLESGVLVTPSLADTILPGITRESVLTLARDMGVETEERRITIGEALESGKEVFVTGTAAGVSYLESITHDEKTKVYAGGKPGELTRNLQNKLKGIQYGTEEDPYGWMFEV